MTAVFLQRRGETITKWRILALSNHAQQTVCVSHGRCRSPHGSEHPSETLASTHTHKQLCCHIDSSSWTQITTNKWLSSDPSSSPSTKVTSWLPHPSPASCFSVLTPGLCHCWSTEGIQLEESKPAGIWSVLSLEQQQKLARLLSW